MAEKEKAAGTGAGAAEEQAVRDRRSRAELAEPQTEVTLRRAKTFRGRAYGPGKVSIPTRIAKALGLADEKSKAAAAKSTK